MQVAFYTILRIHLTWNVILHLDDSKFSCYADVKSGLGYPDCVILLFCSGGGWNSALKREDRFFFGIFLIPAVQRRTICACGSANANRNFVNTRNIRRRLSCSLSPLFVFTYGHDFHFHSHKKYAYKVRRSNLELHGAGSLSVTEEISSQS
jgi:hypothetical protein